MNLRALSLIVLAILSVAFAWGQRPTGDIRAPIDGLVTFIRGVPSMWPRATLVNVAPVLSAPGEWKVSRP